jgi:hypothetical protein
MQNINSPTAWNDQKIRKIYETFFGIKAKLKTSAQVLGNNL